MTIFSPDLRLAHLVSHPAPYGKPWWIKGRWVEKPSERERCFYKLTPAGRRILAQQRATWHAFVAAVNDIMDAGDA